MGEGIHILNKTAITRFPTWCLWVILICMIIFVILAVLSFCNNFAITSTILALINMLICVISICIGTCNEVETGRYKYEVIIDETASFNDIYENYKVIEQCGEIWVLEDKE